MMLFVFFFLFVSCVCKVLSLDGNNFDSTVNGEKNVFVKFYAPWCGHCQKLAPVFAAVEEVFNKTDSIIFAEVQADVEPELSKRFEIQSYPSLLFFAAGSNEEPEKYKGERELDIMVHWLNEHLGTEVRVPKPFSYVVTLTPSTFQNVAFQKDKVVLVKFFAPWCHHCRQLAPTYEQLATVFMEEPNIVIAEIDADMYSSFVHQFRVKGFPTLKLFRNGEILDYNGKRDLVSLVGYMNAAANTYRRIDGNLDLKFGRIPEIDSKLESIHEYTKDTIQQVIEYIDSLSSASESGKRVYKSILRKIESDGMGYIQMEIEKMKKFINNQQIAPTKKTMFRIRQNILEAFPREVNDELLCVCNKPVHIVQVYSKMGV